jgi:hypothetical protein
MYYIDEWPLLPDGEEYDGKRLLELVRNGASPFRDTFDVEVVIAEIERALDTTIVDISIVDKGSNNYVRPHHHILLGCLTMPRVFTSKPRTGQIRWHALLVAM